MLSFQRPAGFDFEPGQRIRIYHGSVERDYSLASGPEDSELRLLVRVFPDGRMSPYLNTLAIGSEIAFYGPMGYFIFRASDRTPVFIATGTGVAPFVSMCRAGVGGFICLHGARRESDLMYRAELHERAARYIPCLSRGSEGGEDGFQGRVTDCLAQLSTDPPYDFYLCGRQEMVRDALEIIDARFEGAHAYSEVFY
jgi:ferredoxin-NADP reductase